MPHLTEEILESYEMTDLSEPAVAAVEEHLLICQRCRDLDEMVRALLLAIRSGLRLPYVIRASRN